MDDWSLQLKSFLNSALGRELIRTLKEDLHDVMIREAQDEKQMENAYALLNQAGGVIKALEHLNFRAVTPRDERPQNNLPS